MKPVVVIGGGLVGCVAALYLARRGLPVVIYERNPDPRLGGRTRRPSISMTLCARGLHSLDRIGLMDRIRPILSPVYGRAVHPLAGEPLYQPYSQFGEAIYCVTRRDLAIALVQATAADGVRILFGHRCTDVDPAAARVCFRDVLGQSHVRDASCIVAADGCHSAVRGRLSASGWCQSSQELSAFGYKELPISAAAAAAAGLRRDALHVWPRRELVAGAFPKADGSFTGSVHLPMVGRRSFAALRSPRSVATLFAEALPDFTRLAPGFRGYFLRQRPNSMMAVRCRPWSAAGKVLLVGDAAHAMLPHFGQGANAGLEDCQLLDGLIEKHGFDWRTVFATFEARRRPDTDAMTDLSDEQFVALRDQVDRPEYQLRTRVERFLQHRFPRAFTPLYSMVTFSSMPYAEARRRDADQRRLVDRFLGAPDIEHVLAQFEARARHAPQIRVVRRAARV